MFEGRRNNPSEIHGSTALVLYPLTVAAHHPPFLPVLWPVALPSMPTIINGTAADLSATSMPGTLHQGRPTERGQSQKLTHLLTSPCS